MIFQRAFINSAITHHQPLNYGLWWVVAAYYGWWWVVVSSYGLWWVVVASYGCWWVVMAYYGWWWMVVGGGTVYKIPLSTIK